MYGCRLRGPGSAHWRMLRNGYVAIHRERNGSTKVVIFFLPSQKPSPRLNKMHGFSSSEPSFALLPPAGLPALFYLQPLSRLESYSWKVSAQVCTKVYSHPPSTAPARSLQRRPPCPRPRPQSPEIGPAGAARTHRCLRRPLQARWGEGAEATETKRSPRRL